MSKRKLKTKAKKLPDQKFFWHFMRCDGTLGYEDTRKPKLGQWLKFIPDKNCKTWDEDDRCYVEQTDPVLCGQGMHASTKIHLIDAYYTPGIRLARVELGKIHDADGYKVVSDKRRIVELWTPLKVRNAILELAQEKFAKMIKEEMKWWLNNCPFKEVHEAIKSGNMEQFEAYKKWLSIPVPYGLPVAIGSLEGFHPLLRNEAQGSYVDHGFKNDLNRLEERIKKEKKIPNGYKGQTELQLLHYLFKDGLTEKKFLEALGVGRRANNVKI